jgi:hypothetical protein
MNSKEKVWAFACTNPDFWPVLRAAETLPPEVVALTGEEREALDSAREEVQNRYCELLRVCWSELLTRWGATGRPAQFNSRRNKATYLSADVSNNLPQNKGEIHIVIGPWSETHLGIWASVAVANKRVSQAREVLTRFTQNGNSFHIGFPLSPDISDEQIAADLHDAYFEKMLAFIDTPEGADSSAQDV